MLAGLETQRRPGVVPGVQIPVFSAGGCHWWSPHLELRHFGLKNLLAVNNVWVVQTCQQRPIDFPPVDSLIECDRDAYKE